jgi:Na+-driven multidrug efflux pump
MPQQGKYVDRLGTYRIGKLLFEFSLPAIVGMVINALYNTVDRIYVGQAVDPLGIAGISVAMPLMLVCTSLAMLIGIEVNSIFSMRLGEGRKNEVEKIMGHAFVILLLVSVFFVIISLIFLNKILVFITHELKHMGK